MLKQRLMRRFAAFTLVELMIVVVIVAILALVAIPMYSTNVTAARMSEAVAGAGTVRSALRTWLATHGGTFPATGAPTKLSDIGFNSNDLDGKYVDQADYSFTATASSANFKVTYATGSKAATGMQGYVIDQAGVESGAWKTGN